jgi:hypothetical protein
MKRYLRMGLAGLLVIGMVSPLFAADIAVTGQVRTRYRYWNNLSLDSNQDAATAAGDRNYFDIRTRFGADAKLSEGVRARIELERYDNFGTLAPNVVAVTNSPNIRQAWLDFQIPGLPEGWRTQMGRTFFSVGHQFVYGNSLTGNDGLTVYGPLGPGTLKAFFSQTNGGAVCCLGEVSGGTVTYEAIDYKFEVAPKQTLEVYGIASQDRGLAGLATTAPIAGGTVVANEFWVGGAYTGAIGPVALRFEGAYQGGTAREDALGGDIDRSAGMLWADATYKIIPEWSVGIDVSYATGDDDPTDKDFNNFVGPLASFATSPTRVWTDSGFFNGNRTARGIGNATTNRVYRFWGRGTLDSDVAPSTANDGTTAFSPGLLETKFHTQYAFNPKVTGFLDVIPAWADKNPGGSGKYIGTEIDAKVAYKPYPNVVMNGYVGYFLPGDFFDNPGLANNVKDDAIVFRAEAVVTF